MSTDQWVALAGLVLLGRCFVAAVVLPSRSAPGTGSAGESAPVFRGLAVAPRVDDFTIVAELQPGKAIPIAVDERGGKIGLDGEAVGDCIVRCRERAGTGEEQG